jgi:hypothetical protein
MRLKPLLAMDFSRNAMVHAECTNTIAELVFALQSRCGIVAMKR